MQENLLSKNEFLTSEIKSRVKSIYDFQKLRQATGNRVIAVFYSNIGGKPTVQGESKTEEQIDELCVQILFSKLSKKFKTEHKITELTDQQTFELTCIAKTKMAEKKEKHFKEAQKAERKRLDVKIMSDDQLAECNIAATESWKEKIELEDDSNKEEVLDSLRAEYRRITDAIVAEGTTVKRFFTNLNSDVQIEYINTESLYQFFSYYDSLLSTEEKMTSDLGKVVQSHPMWDTFFKNVKGCGPLMSGVCLCYFDVYKARHCSSFWKYAGLDVVNTINEDGELVGEARGKKHAKDNIVDYIDKNGETKQKASLGYNPFLRSKLLGVLGGSFLRTGSDYAKIYYDRRNYLENHPNHADDVTIRKHRSALRYMVKMFVRDLWIAWRTVEGLEVTEPYEVAKLGMKPHKAM